MSIDDGRWSGVIRVGLRPKFFSEDKPGTLINDLLLAHYVGPEAVSNVQRAIIYESAKKRERMKRDIEGVTVDEQPKPKEQPHVNFLKNKK